MTQFWCQVVLSLCDALIEEPLVHVPGVSSTNKKLTRCSDDFTVACRSIRDSLHGVGECLDDEVGPRVPAIPSPERTVRQGMGLSVIILVC